MVSVCLFLTGPIVQMAPKTSKCESWRLLPNKYRKEIRSTYRLGRVKEVKVGNDSLVRTVVLEYKLTNETKFRTVSRQIQGVPVIVPIEEQSTLNPDAPPFNPNHNEA